MHGAAAVEDKDDFGYIFQGRPSLRISGRIIQRFFGGLVACQVTFPVAEQGLVIFVEVLIHGVEVENFALKEKHFDNVAEIVSGKSVTGGFKQRLRLNYVEPEREGKSNYGLLAGLVVFVVADFVKVLAVDSRAVVNFSRFLAVLSDKPQQHFGKSFAL